MNQSQAFGLNILLLLPFLFQPMGNTVLLFIFPSYISGGFRALLSPYWEREGVLTWNTFVTSLYHTTFLYCFPFNKLFSGYSRFLRDYKIGRFVGYFSPRGMLTKSIVGFATPEILTWKSILIQFLILHPKGYLGWAQDNPIRCMYKTTVAEI